MEPGEFTLQKANIEQTYKVKWRTFNQMLIINPLINCYTRTLEGERNEEDI